jgi:hypothetical protein
LVHTRTLDTCTCDVHLPGKCTIFTRAIQSVPLTVSTVYDPRYRSLKYHGSPRRVLDLVAEDDGGTTWSSTQRFKTMIRSYLAAYLIRSSYVTRTMYRVLVLSDLSIHSKRRILVPVETEYEVQALDALERKRYDRTTLCGRLRTSAATLEARFHRCQSRGPWRDKKMPHHGNMV